MDTQQAQFYARIMAFEFDEPGTRRTFSARLAEENGWSEDFADRAVFEYRRFLFLAIAAGHAVCPSEEVDEVWHLHLIYSRSYWQRLCGEVLGRPLHHDPSRGGGAEYAKHRAMYDQTLASYHRLFGEEPPEALWPRGTKRFAARSDHRRTDIDGYWRIRKPAFLTAFASWRPIRSSRTALVSLALVPIPLLGVVWDQPFNMRGPDFLVFYAFLLLIAFAVALLTRLIAKAASTRGAEEAPLDAYQMAYLNGGPDWAAKTAVALLLAEQEVIITRTTPLRLGRFGAVRTKGHALERALSASMPAAPEGASWAQVCQRSNDALDDLERSLQERGLTLTRERALVAQWGPLAIMGVAIAIGVIKIVLGLERHRPVGLLAAMCLAALVISLALFVRRIYRTSAGDQKLFSLKVGHQHLRKEARQSPFSIQEGMPLAVALFGLGVLVQGPLQHLAYSLDPRTRMISRPAEGFGGYGGGCGGAGGVGAACGAGGGHGCGGGGGGGCGGGGCGCGGCGS